MGAEYFKSNSIGIYKLTIRPLIFGME